MSATLDALDAYLTGLESMGTNAHRRVAALAQRAVSASLVSAPAAVSMR